MWGRNFLPEQSCFISRFYYLKRTFYGVGISVVKPALSGFTT